MGWFLASVGAYLLVIALIVLCRVLIEGRIGESLNERWLASLFVVVTIVLGVGCLACSVANPETMTDAEHKVLMEYRIQQKQKELAKELLKLRGEQNADPRAK